MQLSNKEFFTIANMLSILRILLVFPIVWLLLNGGDLRVLMFLLIFGVATDWLDGQVARWTNTVSEWGKILDPVADKLAAIGIGGALFYMGKLPAVLFWVIVGREFLILSGSALLAKRLGNVSMSIWTGKVAVFVLSITIIAAVLGASPDVLNVWSYTTAALFVWAFILYIGQGWRLYRGNEHFPLVDALDRFANEIAVGLGVFFFLQAGFPHFKLWFLQFWAIWTGYQVAITYSLMKAQRPSSYLSLFHLAVIFGLTMTLSMFLIPDEEVIFWGQNLTVLVIVVAALDKLWFALKMFFSKHYRKKSE